MTGISSNQSPLVKRKSGVLLWSGVILLGLVLLSGLSLIDPDLVYTSQDQIELFMPNDLVNLIVGFPLFCFALFHFWKDRLVGILLLPGALIYVIYNYLAYALGRTWDLFSTLNLVLVILSMILLTRLLLSINHHEVKQGLEGKVFETFSALILILFGIAFIGLAVSQIVSGIQAGTIPPLGENAVAVADILVSLGWIGGGILLLRRNPLGYSTTLGLLVAASSLFVGLILFFFLAPVLVGRTFDWVEVTTVLGMGFIAFVPTGLFLRGVLKSQSS